MNTSDEKQMTYGDGQAIKILTAEKLGLEPCNVDLAKDHLSGKSIHPIQLAQMDKEATQIHNGLSKDAGALKDANEAASKIASEYGFQIH